MTGGFHDTTRAVLRLSGSDTRDFLQGLVTNDVRRLDDGPVYAALLSPQGRFLHDFFLVADGAAVLLDAATERVEDLLRRLGLYRLRADVEIVRTSLAVVVGFGDVPEAAYRDPRDAEMGWRAVTDDPAGFLDGMPALDPADYAARRVERVIPEAGAELQFDGAYILEMGFERLNGVDFRKGCYVGQEIVARMKHKTDLRKGLVKLRVDGPAPEPGQIIEDGAKKQIGTLYTVAGDTGLAHVRFDRLGPEMMAGTARLSRIEE